MTNCFKYVCSNKACEVNTSASTDYSLLVKLLSNFFAIFIKRMSNGTCDFCCSKTKFHNCQKGNKQINRQKKQKHPTITRSYRRASLQNDLKTKPLNYIVIRVLNNLISDRLLHKIKQTKYYNTSFNLSETLPCAFIKCNLICCKSF